MIQRDGSFLAENLSFSRARVSVEGCTPISFEKMKEELFEMVSIPAWFTVDTRLGSLSIHLETPQCFSAEMYAADLSIKGKPEDDKVVNYVLENMVLDKSMEDMNADGASAPAMTSGPVGSFRSVETFSKP